MVSAAKLGDRWRAEVEVGTVKVVVIGQPGAGIAEHDARRRPDRDRDRHRAAALPERHGPPVRGHAPLPGRRPRGGPRRMPDAAPADRLGRRHRAPPPARPPARHLPPRPRPPTPTSSTSIRGSARLVRVGGLVVDLQPDGFTLDDGTAIGRIVLRGPALERLALIEPDDALNAIGRVEAADGRCHRRRRRSGGRHPGRRPRRRGTVGRRPTATRTVAGPVRHARRGRRLGRSTRRPGRPLPVDAGTAGSGTLVAISAASLAVTLLRRASGRRRLSARIAGRLATSRRPRRPAGDPPGGPSAASSAERGPSTIHSA